ncbi:MAG: hypothetical protein ACJASG_001501, partial [Oleiphilaceae bacterium]
NNTKGWGECSEPQQRCDDTHDVGVHGNPQPIIEIPFK